jgi:hypothetical protein
MGRAGTQDARGKRFVIDPQQSKQPGPPILALLGPQRFRPTVREAVRSLGIEGPVAAVTAGWQERETENTELQEHLHRDVLGLDLYRRYEQALGQDPELAAALRGRQETLKQLQDLYRLRLSYALGAARELMQRTDGGRMLADQCRAAIRAVRTLDRWHLRRIRQIHEAFVEQWHPTRRPAVARHIDELRAIISRTAALCIAGGHVAVLLGRLRLFDIPTLIEQRPVVAWSAGAMAVSDRVVLYHDSPPQGAGDPEILDAGLALCRGLVALPHARKRLKLDDPVRVALFARRFAPATCVVFDDGARLIWDGRVWAAGPGTHRLGRRGSVPAMTES